MAASWRAGGGRPPGHTCSFLCTLHAVDTAACPLAAAFPFRGFPRRPQLPSALLVRVRRNAFSRQSFLARKEPFRDRVNQTENRTSTKRPARRIDDADAAQTRLSSRRVLARHQYQLPASGHAILARFHPSLIQRVELAIVRVEASPGRPLPDAAQLHSHTREPTRAGPSRAGSEACVARIELHKHGDAAGFDLGRRVRWARAVRVAGSNTNHDDLRLTRARPTMAGGAARRPSPRA